MARPKKKRTTRLSPRVFKFSPRGIRGRPDYVKLDIDELETVKLADLDDKEHTEAAKEMAISRQTFERILKKARAKIADSLVNGKIIEIEGVEEAGKL